MHSRGTSKYSAYCDGDIYRNIRTYGRLGNVDLELKWRGRLSKGVHHELARMEKNFKRVKGRRFKLLSYYGSQKGGIEALDLVDFDWFLCIGNSSIPTILPAQKSG